MHGPQIGHQGASTGLIRYWIGRTCLRLAGWDTIGAFPPNEPRLVLIACPHTTNWDGAAMIAAAWVFRVKLHWIAKDTLTKGLLGAILRRFGAVGVDRSKPGGQVQQVAARMRAADRMFLAIAPSGSRSRREFWKSGFYHIAMAADVPVVPAFVDWGNKRVGLFDAIKPSGDLVADMDKFRALYTGMKGKFPENQAPLRLREELDSE